MRKFSASSFIAPGFVALTLLASGEVAAQPVAPVVADAGQAVSSGSGALVKVVRHTRSDADPLSKYGAGFFVMVFNKSDKPVLVGPEQIEVKDRHGNVKTVLTAARLADLKKAEADRAQAFGMMMGLGLAALSGVAAAKPTTFAQSAVLQQDAVAVVTVGNNNAAAINSEGDALQAAYNATPLVSTQTPPLQAAGGRILVEGLKDRDPATLVVHVGDETHEIDFEPAR